MELSDRRIVLLGKTGAGKSATGNTILDMDAFAVDCSFNSMTEQCQERKAEVDGRIISVTDTPGLFDTKMTEEEVKSEIEKCVEMSCPGPHVFLLVIRLDVRYTEEEKNTVEWIQKNFGEDAVKYTIILFNHADVLKGKPLDEYIRKCNNMQSVISHYGGRYHLFNNNERANRDQVTALLKLIDQTVNKNGGKHFSNEMYKKVQWENLKQKAKEYGKTALTVAGTAVVVVGTAVAMKNPEPVVAAAAVLAKAASTYISRMHFY